MPQFLYLRICWQTESYSKQVTYFFTNNGGGCLYLFLLLYAQGSFPGALWIVCGTFSASLALILPLNASCPLWVPVLAPVLFSSDVGHLRPKGLLQGSSGSYYPRTILDGREIINVGTL